MNQSRVRTRRVTTAGLGLALCVTASAAVAATVPPSSEGTASRPAAPSTPATDEPGDGAYRGGVEIIRGRGQRTVVKGRVFDDANRNSTHDKGEAGVGGVSVSNGREVVQTDAHGRYRLPARDSMTVFVTQPAGYQVPLDDNNVAQFSYTHLPAGSPDLKYGGIEPTGPLPKRINFPLAEDPATAKASQACVIAGDLQTYEPVEVTYARKGALADLAARHHYSSCGVLFLGDVVGDDLSLYDEVREAVSDLNGPVRFLPGNHDLDFDAPLEHRFDTFIEQLSPAYYSYDVGQAHVIALNNVRYPCTPDVDNADGLKSNCNDPENKPSYNGRLDAEQLEWLKRDIAATDDDKLIVLAGHIPMLTFADAGSARHQVDQVTEIYELLEGRKAVSLAGHTHSVENMMPGDLFAGWKEIFGVDGLPFPHITAGAVSGDWYSGQMLPEGYPLAVGRDGGRPGVLTLEINGNEFRERYTVRGKGEGFQTQLGLNTPAYREWFTARTAWNDAEDPDGPAPAPPAENEVTRRDLADTSWLTTNFWMGNSASTVTVSLDGGPATEATLTQPATGEPQKVGPEWSDPWAARQQLVHGGSVADRMMHLWRYELPADLRAGKHVAEISAIDAHGREFTDTITFTVVDD